MADETRTPVGGVIPYLSVEGGTAALDFYKRAFGAEELIRHMADDGVRVLHGRLRINGDLVMVSDDFPEYRGGGELPAPAGVFLHLEVEDADPWFARAVEAGATVIMPLAISSGATATASSRTRGAIAGRSDRRSNSLRRFLFRIRLRRVS